MIERRRGVVFAVCVLLLAIAGWYFLAGHATPAGQPALVALNAESFASFKADFNRTADRVRLVVLLSPT